MILQFYSNFSVNVVLYIIWFKYIFSKNVPKMKHQHWSQKFQDGHHDSELHAQLLHFGLVPRIRFTSAYLKCSWRKHFFNSRTCKQKCEKFIPNIGSDKISWCTRHQVWHDCMVYRTEALSVGRVQRFSAALNHGGHLEIFVINVDASFLVHF
jgi:hypothetical protein